MQQGSDERLESLLTRLQDARVSPYIINTMVNGFTCIENMLIYQARLTGERIETICTLDPGDCPYSNLERLMKTKEGLKSECLYGRKKCIVDLYAIEVEPET